MRHRIKKYDFVLLRFETREGIDEKRFENCSVGKAVRTLVSDIKMPVILHPDEESGEEPKELTAAMVEAACQALVEKPDSGWLQKLMEGDLDANDADTIIQQAIFGEQVFA